MRLRFFGSESEQQTHQETSALDGGHQEQTVRVMNNHELLRNSVLAGNNTALKLLLEKISPAEIQIILTENNCELFQSAVMNGCLEVLNALFAVATDKTRRRMMRALSYEHWTRQVVLLGDFTVFNHLNEMAPHILKEKICPFFLTAAEFGHLTVLEALFAPLSAKQVRVVILSSVFGRAFCRASSNGHLAVLEWLIKLVPEEVQAMICTDQFLAFRLAAGKGHLAVLERLIDLAPEQVQAMICAKRFGAFRLAAGDAHLAVLERLIELALEHAQAMICANQFLAFRLAAGGGHLAVLERLIDLAPEHVQAMICADQFGAFRLAAGGGHLAVLERLIDLAPEHVQAMICADQFGAFRLAAGEGHLAVLERLIELALEHAQAMIFANQFGAFRLAAGNGHLAVLERLIELAPGHVQAMICAERFRVFSMVAANGQLAALERLMELAPEHVQAMLSTQEFMPFWCAASKGHLSVLERMIALLSPEQVRAMIKARGFKVFRLATQNGHLAVLERLIELSSPEQVEAMISSEEYEVFLYAPAIEDLSILERLIELLSPRQVEAMISANKSQILSNAIWGGSLVALIRLMVFCSQNQVQEMIYADEFKVFRDAYLSRERAIISYLLGFSEVFRYAEMNDSKYGATVRDFTKSSLAELRAEKRVFLQKNPTSHFDVEDREKAKLYFCMMRYIIRVNDTNLLTELQFLLQIPAIKQLAHTAVTPGQSNELLRLALRHGNQEVIGILLNIRAVRELAEHNNYYRAQPNLRWLAHYSESSMRELTTDEQKCLKEVKKRYRPWIEEKGIEHIIADLRLRLRTRYLEQPAAILTDTRIMCVPGRLLYLPLSWDDFCALELNESERRRALEAYYQHKDHTALRYLSKPNFWIDPNARYVGGNRIQGRWSTFEHYLFEISMCYLAAIDKDTPAIDGHTLVTRFEHFIGELAQIGRAHNWDETREIINSAGERVREEYDDLRGDKPSCPSGVARRLFQSVLGHPLFNILRLEHIRNELREFMREHFKQRITDENRVLLQQAWCKLIDEGLLDEDSPLAALDVTIEEQDRFLEYLAGKYGDQFTEEPLFRQHIMDRFKMSSIFQMHAVRFGGETDLTALLLSSGVEKTKERIALDEFCEASLLSWMH